ncbi:MAG: glycosyltransferase [Ichthyobacteriaceae bacterium]|nr:glycosyltransferase [Ichthyobacteriaceae bacterium]
MIKNNKLLINLIPIKRGGGLQVAINFISNIGQLSNKKDYVFLCNDNSPVYKKVVDEKLECFSVKDSLFNRIKFETLQLEKLISDKKISTIYTLFGPALTSSKTFNVVGSAYSNIYFPEINFWNTTTGIESIKKKLIDKYRLSQTLKADAIIFENVAMQNRVSNLFKFPVKSTTFIRPSISSYSTSENNEVKIDSNKFNILMLTGWHPNKNLTIIPEVLHQLKKQNINDVEFVITVDNSNENIQKLISECKSLGVNGGINAIGNVDTSFIPDLYSKVSAVGLFSLLESFSNNIIESYHFKKPLLISDLEWSQSICNNIPVYVDRNNAKDIADKIIALKSNPEFYDEVVNRQAKELELYPTPKEKVELQLNFIKQQYENWKTNKI